MGASLGPLSGEVLPVSCRYFQLHFCQVVHACDEIAWDPHVFSSIEQTLAGKGFHQAEVVLEQALGCCGLGPVETLGELQRIDVACVARLTAVAETARTILLWSKLV